MLMYMRQAWQDSRLATPDIVVDKGRRVPEELIDEVWQPDTFFRNARSTVHTSDMTDERLMNINSTGHVWFVQK
jgi:hypothetical protein